VFVLAILSAPPPPGSYMGFLRLVSRSTSHLPDPFRRLGVAGSTLIGTAASQRAGKDDDASADCQEV
jgi:hypothetical protein